MTKNTETWFPEATTGTDVRCPHNIGVVCVEQSPCERCGWYPPEARRRRENRNRALRYGMPTRCLGCKLAKLCHALECAKPDCDYYVGRGADVPDQRLEMEERK